MDKKTILTVIAVILGLILIIVIGFQMHQASQGEKKSMNDISPRIVQVIEKA